MTRIFITIVLSFLAFFGFSQQSENRDLKGFSGIQVARSVEVVFTQSPNFSVKVETELSENLPKITTILDGETLVVSIDKQYQSVSIGGHWKKNSNKSLYLKNAIVHISAPKLSFIKCSSSGTLKMTNTLKATDLMLETSSSGNIFANIEAKNVFISASSSGDYKGQINTNYLEAKASSSGDINITGTADKTDVIVSSSGDFKGKGFRAKEANLQASSSGDITIEVNEKLKANASSSGSIYIHGKPSIIDKKTSSSGSITQI